MKNVLLLVVVVSSLLIITARCQNGAACNSNPTSCSCDTDDGLIDLTSLGYTDGNSYFSEYDPSGNQYFYNPCHDIQMGSGDCSYSDVAICLEYTNGDASCGAASSESIVLMDDGYHYALYNYGSAGRSAEVRLICDETADTPTFQAYGDSIEQLHYTFDLTTKCACPGGCSDSLPTDDFDKPTDPTDFPNRPTEPTDFPNRPTEPTDDPNKPTEPTDDPNKPTDPNNLTDKWFIVVGVIGIVLIVLILFALLSCFIVGAIMLNKFQKIRMETIPQKESWSAIPHPRWSYVHLQSNYSSHQER